jgi:hypothetical protein
MKHSLVDIMDMSTDRDAGELGSTQCQQHQERIGLYCKDHHAPGCGSCIAEKHRTCASVVPIEDEIKELRDPKEAGVILDKLKANLKTADEMGVERSKQANELDRLKSGILVKISNLRSEINGVLAELEERVTGDFNSSHKEEHDKIQSQIAESSDLTKVVEIALVVLDDAGQQRSDMQLLATVSTLLEDCSSFDNSLRRLHSEMEVVEYEFVLPESLRQIMIALRKLDGLGRVGVVRSSTQIVLDQSNTPLGSRRAEEFGSINVRTPGNRNNCWITGGEYI